MSQTIEQAVIVSDQSAHSLAGVLYKTHFNTRERLLRAVSVVFISWGVALITVLVPIAHFILVPFFFILGPVLGWLRFRQEILTVGVKTCCPGCHQMAVISMEGVTKLPAHVYCPLCDKPLIIKR